MRLHWIYGNYFSTVIIERKAREFDPTVNFLKKFAAESKFSEEEKDAKKRVEDILTLMETLSIWGDEMIRLKPETLTKNYEVWGKDSKLDQEQKMTIQITYPLTIFYDASCPLCSCRNAYHQGN